METAPLLELMSAQAQAQCDELLAKAREEADAIVREARDQSNADRDVALRTLKAELAEAERKARERADATAHMATLTAKDAITDEVLTSVLEDLARFAESPAFVPVLERLLEELIEGAPADAIVLSHPKHLDTVRAWLARNGRSGMQTAPLAALTDGVAVQDAARTYRTTNSLRTRFAINEGKARKRCMQRLFGGGA